MLVLNMKEKKKKKTEDLMCSSYRYVRQNLVVKIFRAVKRQERYGFLINQVNFRYFPDKDELPDTDNNSVVILVLWSPIQTNNAALF